jgi:hypothetical protein
LKKVKSPKSNLPLDAKEWKIIMKPASPEGVDK